MDKDEFRFVLRRSKRFTLVGSSYKLSIVGLTFGIYLYEPLRLTLLSLVNSRFLKGSKILLIFLKLDRDGIELKVFSNDEPFFDLLLDLGGSY